MHTSYADILARIDDEPQWFDEAAVPRFSAFKPDDMSNIYAQEAVLALIKCQACRHPFHVAFSEPMGAPTSFDGVVRLGPVGLLRTDIIGRRLHYGDPPNIWCCDSGPTMNSVPVRVLEYWVKPIVLGEGLDLRRDPETGAEYRVVSSPKAMEWQRDPRFEVDILPDWAL